MLKRPQDAVVDMGVRVDETLDTVPKVDWDVDRGPLSGGFGREIVLTTRRRGLVSNHLGP